MSPEEYWEELIGFVRKLNIGKKTLTDQERRTILKGAYRIKIQRNMSTSQLPSTQVTTTISTTTYQIDPLSQIPPPTVEMRIPIGGKGSEL